MDTKDSAAVLILIFNRPEKVRALMSSLADAKPSRLYIAADGPRPGNPLDTERCAEARRIAQDVSWPCDVRTHFSDTNLGVDPAVEAGINWFFENETEGIILEDDCLPSPDFFRFTHEMLERYRENSQIMMISGNNFQNGRTYGDADYYFSEYSNTWGWATWKRAWDMYDSSLSSYPNFSPENGGRTFPREEARYWQRYFKSLYEGTRTAWDAKWMYAIWNAGGLAITPNVNLVQNIGFGTDATHTRGDANGNSITAGKLPSPLRHPSTVQPAYLADRQLFATLYKVTIRKRLAHLKHLLFTR